MNINYCFNCEYAKRFGVDEAIMLENLIFWIKKNKANGKHFHDGRYWTYNSIKAFEELFPFWSKRQIERILKSLEKQNILYTGNYNKSHYDRTKWYAINEKVISFSPNKEMEKHETGNENNGTVEPIPDINTNINTFIKTDINSIEKDDDAMNSISSTKVQVIIDKWNSLNLKKVISINPGTNRHKLLNARIKQYGIEMILEAIDNINKSSFLRGQNNKQWTITFDWLIKPNNFIKVLEGNYNDRSQQNSGIGNKGGFNNESRSNTSKNNEPSKGESKDEHDAKYWEEQNRILNEGIDF